jgi:death-on-curing protein
VARVRYLDRDDVQFVAHRIATSLFSDYPDPLPPFQLGDRGELLDSALGLVRPPYYHSIYHKAGALVRSLTKNHPLVDGNKRIGMSATLIFLLWNERVLVASNDKMVGFALEVAKSSPAIAWEFAADWLRARSVPLKEAEATLRTMRRTLPPSGETTKGSTKGWNSTGAPWKRSA